MPTTASLVRSAESALTGFSMAGATVSVGMVAAITNGRRSQDSATGVRLSTSVTGR